MALNGWHRGEKEIHRKLNSLDDPAVNRLYMYISGEMPGDHAHFHSTCLSFLPVTTLDDGGRPWGSILASKEGKPGFVKSPRYSTLRIDATLWDGEPLIENSKLFGRNGQKMLVAGIGIEFETRRRNKFAGFVTQLNQTDGRVQFDLEVNQSLGNCPKYINVRDLVPYPSAAPKIAHQKAHLSPNDRLPDEAIALIHASDTVFFGTTYNAFSQDSVRFPSHLGMNHRGGRPGFVRVVPSDGRTVVIPDFSGNRFMTTLGNIEATPLACLTFVDFETGDILYLTGGAENLFGPEASKLMPFQKALSTVYVTGYTLVRDALPVRQRNGTAPERSPYSPPIRFLAEEVPSAAFLTKSEKATALLSRIDIHSSSIATFTWQSSVDLDIKPGQAIIMDMSPLVGVPAYRHMAPGKPTSLNDDSIRTWTVSSSANSASSSESSSSSSSSSSGLRSFALTMREKRGGAVTTPLFTIARKLAELKPEALADSRPLQLRVGIIGVTGSFVLPSDSSSSISDADLGLMVPMTAPPPNKMLWVAGGIGVTPFLSMLRAISHSNNGTQWDIRLVLATREPEVLVPLVADALGAGGSRVKLTLEVFSTKTVPKVDSGIVLREHVGRMPLDFFDPMEFHGREVYLCGSPGFEKAALAALAKGGVPEGVVKREGFEY
ncbi:putative PNPOx domain-containing protein [Mycena sanguinolenta]|uniref:Putative PNPOx domain-containing protein n=1 Tax=Mycena sanguinolenta TaxID=230812 RepID=A0A8H6ZCQ8_9AGAR|nr:putative PNPOx domain-containing protein [Mycena sanguinolenta]